MCFPSAPRSRSWTGPSWKQWRATAMACPKPNTPASSAIPRQNGRGSLSRLTGVNDAPNAQNHAVSLSEGGSVGGNALEGAFDADGDAFSIVAVDGDSAKVATALTGAWGTLTLAADGTFSYKADRPAAADLSGGETATDTFSFTVSDGQGGTTTRDLTFTVEGADNVIVGSGTLAGTNGRDLMFGDVTADTLDGRLGADLMMGGAGNDTFLVDNAADVVVEAANGGIDTVQATVSYALSAEVENLVLLGAAVSGTGNAGANALTGNDAANVLDGAGGNDIFLVDNFGDQVQELAGSGLDAVRSAVGFTLAANVETLTLLTGAVNGTGNALANTILGNAADNRLDGGAGLDKLTGGLGNDTYIVDTAGDVIVEALNQGTDTVLSSAASYTLSANVENLTLAGSGNLDATGNGLNNMMTGNAGANTLDGGAGNDASTAGLAPIP